MHAFLKEKKIELVYYQIYNEHNNKMRHKMTILCKNYINNNNKQLLKTHLK